MPHLVTHFAIDAAGNHTSLTDPAGNDTAWSYDAWNRVTSETNELNQTRSFVYDLNSNLTRRVDRLGRATDFSYDALNRRTGETWLDANLLPLHEFSYSFDAAGQLLAAGDDAAEYEYAYDLLGRATEITQTFAALAAPVVFAQSYDLAGRRTQLAATIGTTADFVNDYEYDLLGRLTRLEQHGLAGGAAVAEKRVDFSYNARSQFAQITRYAALAGTPNDEVVATRFA